MINKLTSNVLEDISRRLQGGKRSDCNGVIVVFNGSNIRLDKKIEYIRAVKQRGVKVSLAFSFMAERILDTKSIIDKINPHMVYREEDIFKLQDILDEYSIIIGPNITINTLSKVALGMIDSFVPNLIWSFLYQGKKVYLDFTSVKQYLGEESKNPGIKNLIDSHIKALTSMGTMEVNDDNFNQVFSIGEEKSVGKNEIKDINKKVITENDILSISPSTSLILPKGSILTPLAKEKAKEKGIMIKFK